MEKIFLKFGPQEITEDITSLALPIPSLSFGTSWNERLGRGHRDKRDLVLNQAMISKEGRTVNLTQSM